VSDEHKPAFERDVAIAEPGLVGARWWNRALQDEAAAMSRRSAMRNLLVGAGVLGAVAACGVGIVASVQPDTEERLQASLAAQRLYGWNLGARDRALLYEGFAMQLQVPSMLSSLIVDTLPHTWGHLHDRTLFEAPAATPTANLAEESVPFVPLSEQLRAMVTPAMRRAFDVGVAVASLFRGRTPAAGLVVDLPGPESVAFAAGAASVLEPVFGIANWPHPLGVVPAHLTLAAVAHHQPEFQRGRADRPRPALPCFVLDRNRLPEAVDHETRFDNRYMASLPSAAALRGGGVYRLLYVVATPSMLPELEDLNDDMVDLARAGIAVSALALDAFSEPFTDGRVYYGGDPSTHEGFWAHYPWAPAAPEAADPWQVNAIPRTYHPTRRATLFSRAAPPAGFATVPLVVAGASVLGVAFDRRGSWNRSSGSWGGG
jgi:hypothetical protein